MSEHEEERLREIVRDEVRKGWWKVIAVFGILALGLGVRSVQDSTRLKDHLSDGHPRSVLELYQEHRVLLREIRVNLAHLREGQAELKKGIDKKL